MTQIQQIVQTLETLPLELQQIVADFVVSLAQRRQAMIEQTPEELSVARQASYGRFKGVFTVPDDFDEPLEDFKDYM